MGRPTLPVARSINWDTILNNAIYDVSDRADAALASVSSGVGGYQNFDSFAGSTDTAKMTACLSYVAAQTFKPKIRLSNRQYNFTGPFDLVNGLTLAGPQMEREYTATSSFWSNEPSCRVSTTSASGYFWGMPGAAGALSYVGSIYMENIHWDGGNQGHNFIESYLAYPCPVLALSTFAHSGWTNYKAPFANVVQGNNIYDFHFQNNASSAIFWSGSDCTIGVAGMHQFVDNEGNDMPSMRLALSASFVNGLYITPSGAGCAIEFDSGSGCMFTGNNFDSAAQIAGGMCDGSLIQLRGGTSIWNGTRLFGCMVNPTLANGGTAQNKGYVTVTGGSHVFANAMFENGISRKTGSNADFTPPNTPHIYATSTAEKVVIAGLAAPGVENLRLVQQSAGKFVYDMAPFVTIG